MKFIITESKLTNLVFDYLDGLDLYMIEYHGDYIFWSSEESWLNSGNVLISTHRSHNDCFISSDLVSEISNFFNLDMNSALLLISGWVSGKVRFDVGYPYSDYGAD